MAAFKSNLHRTLLSHRPEACTVAWRFLSVLSKHRLAAELFSNRPARPARWLGDFLSVLSKHRLAAELFSNRPARPARWLGDFLSVLSKHCLTAGLAAFLLASFVAGAAPAPNSADAVLSLYAGTWTVTRKNAPAGSKPEELRNQCDWIGKYFGCEQSVNGSVTGLLIVIPTKEPGHYNTQIVLPEGRATGKGELAIAGDRWVFTSIWNQGVETVRYRTTNVFAGKNRIHFEQEESTDGVHWETTASGDDVRVSGGKR